MAIGISYGFVSSSPPPLSERAGLMYNRQKLIAEQDAKTGLQYDLQKEVIAVSAPSVVDLVA